MNSPIDAVHRLGRLVGLLGMLVVGFGVGSVAAQNQLLSPGEAFRPAAEAVGPDRVRISWEVAEGYYLFRDRFELQVVEPAGARVTAMETPAGMAKYDPSLRKRRRIYRGEAWLKADLAGIDGADEVTVTVRYQGSADALDAGICLPVQNTKFDVALP
jgi:thiol:disulfide interchange protein DsbD